MFTLEKHIFYPEFMFNEGNNNIKLCISFENLRIYMLLYNLNYMYECIN